MEVTLFLFSSLLMVAVLVPATPAVRLLVPVVLVVAFFLAQVTVLVLLGRDSLAVLVMPLTLPVVVVVLVKPEILTPLVGVVTALLRQLLVLPLLVVVVVLVTTMPKQLSLVTGVVVRVDRLVQLAVPVV